MIIIIGPPGAGKTEVGKELAKSLHWDFYDTDYLIENAMNMKISEIFFQYTETVFRQLENALTKNIREICEKTKNSAQNLGGTVLSCGGGLPVAVENFDNLLSSGQVICLQASISTLAERVMRVKNRPLLNHNSFESETDSSNRETQALLESLISKRKSVYAKAEHQIDTTNQSVEEVVKTIKTTFELY